MNDLIRSSIYTGAGSLVLAKKKFEEFVEELIQNNDLTQDEGRRVVQALIHQAEDLKEGAEQKLLSVVDEWLLKARLPARNELEVRLHEWMERIRSFNLIPDPSKTRTDKPVAN